MEESEDLSQRLGQGDRKLEGEPVLRYKGARCKTRTSRISFEIVSKRR